MLTYAKSAIVRLLWRFGYRLERRSVPQEPHYLQLDSNYSRIVSAVEPFTMTPYEKIGAMVDAVRYISKARIPGSVVECGVWRGGSMMAAAFVLLEANDIRDLYLFDTFAGMTKPTDADRDRQGVPASLMYEASKSTRHNEWCYASLDDVRHNLLSTGYPEDRCHFIKGDVLQTLPHPGVQQIALLRLDTDWYESTLHELVHLYPKLQDHGILLIDDYGCWQGCRKAVDEFFGADSPFLCAIDSTGRLAVKPVPDENRKASRGSRDRAVV